jgi:cyclic-di-GMP-binding protein
MPSFDVVSKLEWSEVKNALNQAQREVAQRFDFKGTNAEIEQTDQGFLITASTEDRVNAAYLVFKEKLIRRKVSLKHFDADDPVPGPRSNFKLRIRVEEGISSEKARKIVKFVKEAQLKVQAAIQEDTVRITGKKRDDLQVVIRALRGEDFEVELQFVNFRD